MVRRLFGKVELDGKSSLSKLEWMMQQTSSRKIDDNGMVLNGWLARIHHMMVSSASFGSMTWRKYQDHIKS